MQPDSSSNPFSYQADTSDYDSVTFFAPMDDIENGSGKKLIINLDVAATSSIYSL
jgi:hypothetical protein